MPDKKPKRPPGRPKKPSYEKAKQFSITLSPNTLFGLDLIARDRRESLAQVAELAIVTLARSYMLDGEPVWKYMQRAAVLDEAAAGSIFADLHDGKEYSKEELEAIVRQFFDVTGLGKIVFSPNRLLSAEERYALEVWEKAPALLDQPELFKTTVRNGFEKSLPADESARTWITAVEKARGAKLEKRRG